MDNEEAIQIKLFAQRQEVSSLYFPKPEVSLSLYLSAGGRRETEFRS